MKNREDYSVDDFIGDDSFIRWVRFPAQDSDSSWATFVATHPEKGPEIEAAIEFVKLLRDQKPVLPEERLLELHRHINDRIDVPVSASTVHQIIRSRSRKSRGYSLAAVIAFTLLGLTSWWLVDKRPAVDSIPAITLHKEISTNHLQELVIPKGKRSRITLADKTEVWINADSKLEYSNDFLSKPTRDVYLEGEAYFDVAPDKEHPFIVHVQGVEVKVLGTSFNIKGYRGEQKVEATLVHGRITVAGDSTRDRVDLSANQRAVFLKDKKELLIENNVQTDTYTSWRKGVLVFNDQPLQDILPILERTFNVSIHTSDASSLDCRFTAKISNKSLEEVLDLFRTSDTIGYTIVADDVYLEGSFCED